MSGIEEEDQLFTLKEAADLFRSDKITDRLLRTEIAHGRLRSSKLGGKIFVSLRALKKWLMESQKCQEGAEDQNSYSMAQTIETGPCANAVSKISSGTFAGTRTVKNKNIQPVAEIVKKLKNTSSKHGSPHA